MKKIRIISMLMTAVLAVTSVVPQSALYANAEGDVIIEEVSEDDTVSGNDSGETPEEEVSGNSAVEETVSENESGNEAVSGNDIAETELPDGIKGMPEGYVLSAKEADIKADMISHDVLGELNNAVAGVDYVEDQVYCIADTKEYAQEIAEAYGIELIEYNYKVAIFSTKDSGRSVSGIVALGTEQNLELPPLSPNYIGGENVQDIVPGMTDTAWMNVNDPAKQKYTASGWEDTVNLFSDPDEYLYPDSPDYQWWHDMMDTYACWGAYNGLQTDDNGIYELLSFYHSGISVAVIDSGVDKDNAELSGHTTVGSAGGGENAGGEQGTQVAGIIAAEADNGIGGAGVAPGVKLISYRNTDASGRINSAYTAAALLNAAEKGCNIAYVSNRGGMYDAVEESAVIEANKAKVTILAPAGDDGANNVNYPAQYDQVIAVGAVQQDCQRASFSTYGKGIVDVYAPGVEISNYGCKKTQGTAMACAAATGACALYMSIAGAADPDTMEEILTGRTIKSASSDAGAGIVNVARMLEGDTTAPVLEVYGTGGKILRVDSGNTGKAAVDPSDYIKVIPMLESGKENTKQHTQVYYTVNGKTPSFTKTGAPSSFTSLSDIGYINIKPYINLLADKQQPLTIKVVCVTGIGVVSKVTTLKLTVNPVNEGTLYIYGVPVGKLASGGSLQLEAWLQKGNQYSGAWKEIKNAVWSIEKGNDIASINKKTGTLKSIKGKSGEIEVSCTYKEGNLTVTGKEMIIVGDFAPVRSFTLSDTDVKIGSRESKAQGLELNKVVSVTSAKNSDDAEIINEDNVGYKWTSSDIGVAAVFVDAADPLGRTARIRPQGKGKATITCMATDGSNKSVKIKVTVVQITTGIEIIGQDSLYVGGKAAFKVKLKGPNNLVTGKGEAPDDKSVTWSLSPTDIKKAGNKQPGGDIEIDGGTIKIDKKKGIVSITGKPSIQEFYVYASANDGGGTYGSKCIKITEKKTGSISFATEAAGDVYQIKKDKEGSITSLQLYTADVSVDTIDGTGIIIDAVTDSGSTVTWKSSKESVVSVAADGKSIKLKAAGAGISRITCTANDGSGKKARFTVKVIVPASNLMLSNDNLLTEINKTTNEPYAWLGIGNTTKTKVTAGDTYGKPSYAKVTWKYELVEAKWDSGSRSFIVDPLSDEVLKKAKEAGLFSGSNGSLCFSRDYATKLASAGLSGKELAVRVSATATDGSDLSAGKLFIPSKRVERIWIVDPDSGKELKTKTVNVNAKKTFEVDDSISLSMGADYLGPNSLEKSIFYFYEASVNSSNPTVATAYLEKSGKLRISYGSQKGTATITCKAMDGSGKKCTIKVTVK